MGIGRFWNEGKTAAQPQAVADWATIFSSNAEQPRRQSENFMSGCANVSISKAKRSVHRGTRKLKKTEKERNMLSKQ